MTAERFEQSQPEEQIVRQANLYHPSSFQHHDMAACQNRCSFYLEGTARIGHGSGAPHPGNSSETPHDS